MDEIVFILGSKDCRSVRKIGKNKFIFYLIILPFLILINGKSNNEESFEAGRLDLMPR